MRCCPAILRNGMQRRSKIISAAKKNFRGGARGKRRKAVSEKELRKTQCGKTRGLFQYDEQLYSSLIRYRDESGNGGIYPTEAQTRLGRGEGGAFVSVTGKSRRSIYGDLGVRRKGGGEAFGDFPRRRLCQGHPLRAGISQRLLSFPRFEIFFVKSRSNNLPRIARYDIMST